MLHIVDSIETLLETPLASEAMRESIKQGDIYIIKKVLTREWALRFREYLTSIGQYSLPNYEPIELGAPNSHRINRSDPRAHVQGCFHQFVFYPWNQDIPQVFEQLASVYQLREQLSPMPEQCVKRIAVQFYPKGEGYLNSHQDSPGQEQIAIPLVCLSEKGRDYELGGGFVESAGERIDLDSHLSLGDVCFINLTATHGVAPIDPKASANWLDFQGRWSMLCAINPLPQNQDFSPSKDLVC